MSANYRALTRKYRPQTFEDIVSQEHVSSTLKNAIASGRLSHAYMFCGPRGVGKTTMARVLARAINQVDDSVDGEMLSQTLNIVEIDAASNNKVEDVHHLREVVRVPPQNGNYKIFIIDEVHMLSKQAFNALLKTLEEPPPYAIFIFATTEPHKILPTILSRVQRFDFRRISVEEIVERLREISAREGITIDNESLHTIARRADGALRDALGLMDQAIAFCGLSIGYQELVSALNMVGNDQLFDFTSAVADQDSTAALRLIDRLLKEGVDIQEFLVSLSEHIRNIYVAAASERMYLVEATQQTKQRYKEVASSFTGNDLMRMLHLVSEAQIRIREVQQPRVHFEIMTLKLVHMSRSAALEELLETAGDLKKKTGHPVNNPAGNKKLSLSGSGSGEELKDYLSVEQEKIERHTAEAPSFGGTSLRLEDERDEEVPASEGGNSAEIHPSAEPADGAEAEEEEALEEELILNGRPALRVNTKAEPESEINFATTEKQLSGIEKTTRIRNLEEVEARWSDYLALLNQSVSKMLFHQMEHVKLKELRGNELILSVYNPFAATMVEENRTELAALLKTVIGIHLRFRCVEEREVSVNPQSLSPYERFRDIQKKDPHLKTIVKLFGAEVQY